MTDLVQQKIYKERLHMRNNLLAFKITKDNKCYVGTAKDIAKIVKCNENSIAFISLYYPNTKGWIFQRIGMYKKVIEVYKNNEFAFKGHVEDIANKLCTTELRIVQLCNHDIKAQKEYTFKFKGEFELVEMRI